MLVKQLSKCLKGAYHLAEDSLEVALRLLGLMVRSVLVNELREPIGESHLSNWS